MEIKLSVIIVSFNTKEVLINCLKTLEKFLDRGCSEVIVVDNNSSDGTVEALRANFRWVKVIVSGENLGFGRANNLGAKDAKGEFLWILNGDTLLLDKEYEKMVSFLENHPKIGAIGPRLVLEDQKTEQEGQYGKDPNFGNLVFRKMNELRNPKSQIPNPKIKESRQIGTEFDGFQPGDQSGNPSEGFYEADWVTGAAMLMRHDLYEKIGGFDGRFMLYFEDTDLCRRVRQAGYKVGWLETVTIVHLGGQSLTGWKRKQFYYQNQERYFVKYYGKMSVYLLRLLRLPIFIKNYFELKGWMD